MLSVPPAVEGPATVTLSTFGAHSVKNVQGLPLFFPGCTKLAVASVIGALVKEKNLLCVQHLFLHR
jgi:hypothetical protein